MGDNIIWKILRNHIIEGELVQGNPINIDVQQTLSHDLTGIMVAQTLNAVKSEKVSTEATVFYVDHNTITVSSENADDQAFLKSTAAKYGCYYSKPGNGICHFLHCQRFARPGSVLIGADSHTPTSGALGQLAIGSGGLTVAKASLGEGFRMTAPKVLSVKLIGKLRPGVTAKDIALEILRILTVKGGVGYILEYTGDGVNTLSIAERQTIANMSIEVGATSGVFQSDEVTKKYLISQGREDDWIELLPDEDAEYDDEIVIDLNTLEPLVAKPHMPDNVYKVKDNEDVRPGSVFIGACTNASYTDIARAARILKGKKIHKDIDLTITPGSKQVLEKLIDDGVLSDLVKSGARILESACGPCVGVGQVPPHNGISVRTSNRNFPGRSGNNYSEVYLVSPETAAITAITGHLTDPMEVGKEVDVLSIQDPNDFNVDDSLIISPEDVTDSEKTEIIMGPEISVIPEIEPVKDSISGGVVIKLGDNITTDDIIPAGSAILKYIGNVPKFAEFTFCYRDKNFVKRSRELGRSIIIGGDNYGQGSSREHAAMLPRVLGVEAILTKSYARIHKENLFNYGIIPLNFKNPADYENLEQGDTLVIDNILESIESGNFIVSIPNKGIEIEAELIASDFDKYVLKQGGVLNYLSNKFKKA